MKKSLVIMIVIAFIVGLFANGQYLKAEDKKEEHPALSRYKEAEMVAYLQQDYVSYVLGTGLQERKDEDFRGKHRYFSSYIDLEGKLTRIQYQVPIEEGIFKVFKNYESALEEAGYQILFTTSEKESSWPFWNEDVYHHEWGINALRGGGFKKPFGRDGFRFIAAKGLYKGNNIYFAIFINNDGDHVLITQDVIEVNPMESGLVTAKKIEDNMKLDGFVSIYGIHFDTDKWTIKEDSRPALEEIAEFLNSHQEDKYYIVGHTDSVGDFSYNKNLSEKRAQAVMNELIAEYGVDKNQIEAYGVASLSPVTSNATDAGKARNRRVEIVEQ